MAAMFERLYRRLGPRYPRAALATTLRVEYIVVGGGSLLLRFSLPAGFGELVALGAVAVVLQELYAQLTLRYFRDRLARVAEWIAGARDEPAAVVAWREAAAAPYRLLRLSWRGGY